MDILERIREEDARSIPLIDESITRYRELGIFIEKRIQALSDLKKSFATTMPTVQPEGRKRGSNLPRGSMSVHIREYAEERYPATFGAKDIMEFFKEAMFDTQYGRMPSLGSIATSLSTMTKDGVLRRAEKGLYRGVRSSKQDHPVREEGKSDCPVHSQPEK